MRDMNRSTRAGSTRRSSKKISALHRRRVAVAAAIVLAPVSGYFGESAHAASATWSATPGDANWIPSPSTDTNWSTGAGLYPGSTTVTTNSDTATLSNNEVTAGNATIALGSNL